MAEVGAIATCFLLYADPVTRLVVKFTWLRGFQILDWNRRPENRTLIPLPWPDTWPPFPPSLRPEGGYWHIPAWVEPLQVWPDGQLRERFDTQYLTRARAAVETERDRVDAAPLPLPDDEGYGVGVGSYAQWAGLSQLAARHRADPARAFERTVLRRVVLETGVPAGTYEVPTAAALEALVAAREARHHRAHNARHLVEADYLPLVDALETAWAASPVGATADEGFAAAYAAVEGFAIGARLASAMAPDRQTPPMAPLVAVARQQAVERLEAAAALRLSVVLGETQTWAMVLSLQDLDVAGLRRLVDAGREAVAMAETVEAVEAAAAEAAAAVGGWTPAVTVTAEARRVAEARAVDVVVTATAEVSVRVQAYHREASQPEAPLMKTSDGEYVVEPFKVQAGPGQEAVVRLTVPASAPRDRHYVLRLRAALNGGRGLSLETPTLDVGRLAPVEASPMA